MKKVLISIIIPTYNRAHLIGETLESIIAQTYQNWECIIVDDGSSDYTKELLTFYQLKDIRIKFYPRPKNLRSGANACRNYGFELSKGEYIQWFDSDDLMMPENIQVKMQAFMPRLNFVIGNSVNFNEKGEEFPIFKPKFDIDITPENFITGKIGWITDDVIFKKKSINIKFRENLQSGQEYNFFSRFLYHTNSGLYIKKCTVWRRIHSDSIQENLKVNSKERYLNNFINEYYLIKDINCFASKELKERSLKRMIRYSYLSSSKHYIDKRQYRTIIALNTYGYFQSGLIYLLWILSNVLLGKGYFLIKKTTNKLTC